jgi:hypothetical protein
VIRRVIAAVGILAILGCVPRLEPLAGVPAPARFPNSELRPVYKHIVFRWELEDNELNARGEGVARIAPPDSVRLDFFLAGGMGGGAAVLVGDSLTAPGPDMVRRLVPPIPLLWASLGRLAIPALPDTIVRVDGSTLRADIGRPTMWRVTFRGDSLVRVERVRDGRIVQWVERDEKGALYRDNGARRALRITVTRTNQVPAFDASIWRLP